MIYQLSEGKTDKYQIVSEINDIDDFYLWIGFKNREKNIEKYFMDRSSGDESGTSHKGNKQTYSSVSDIPADLLKKFQGN